MKANYFNLNLKPFLLLLVTCLVLFSFPSQSHQSRSASDDYVTIQGDKFYLNGEPFILKGFNYFPRNSLRQSMVEWNWNDVSDELDSAKSMGANVIRTFIDYGFSVGEKYEPFEKDSVAKKKTITKAYAAAINSFLSIAKERQLKVIFSVYDFMPGWAFLKTADRSEYIQYAHDYYKNLLNDHSLKDSTTIFAWDILNEGDILYTKRDPKKPEEEPATYQEFIEFCKNIVPEIKNIVNGKQYVTVNFAEIDSACALKNIVDFVSFQYYGDQAKYKQKIDKLINQTDKPIVAMEIGYHSNRRIYEKGTLKILAPEYPELDKYGEQITSINSYLDVSLNYENKLAGALIWSLTDFTFPSDSSWRRDLIRIPDTIKDSNNVEIPVDVNYDNFHGVFNTALTPKASASQVSKYFNNEFSNQYRWDFEYTAYDTNAYTPETKYKTDRRTFGLFFIGTMKFISKKGVVLDSIVFGSSDSTYGANRIQGRGWYSNEPGYGTTCQWAGNREKVASMYYTPPGNTDFYYIRLASDTSGNKLNIFLNNKPYPDDTLTIDIIDKVFKVPTSVAAHNGNWPRTFALYQNYPNPFNPSTTIKYQLSKSEHVEITIFNILGKRVRILVDDNKESAIYSVDWNGRDDKGVQLASGVYFCRMEASDFVFVRKMLIIR
jgi:hypothetical protein